MKQGVFAVCITAIISTAAYAGSVNGIRDGDTFILRDRGYDYAIRLCGIDAPERGQPGAREATKALETMIAGKVVTCIYVGHGTPCDGRSKRRNRDRYVAQCFVGGADIAMKMICGGHAVDWPAFSDGYYDPANCKETQR